MFVGEWIVMMYLFHRFRLQSPSATSSASDQFDCILHLETELASRNDLISELREKKDAELQELQVIKNYSATSVILELRLSEHFASDLDYSKSRFSGCFF